LGDVDRLTTRPGQSSGFGVMSETKILKFVTMPAIVTIQELYEQILNVISLTLGEESWVIVEITCYANDRRRPRLPGGQPGRRSGKHPDSDKAIYSFKIFKISIITIRITYH
jgi:hypothetical protein